MQTGATPRGSITDPPDANSQLLPWKIAFRVQFQSEKFGLRFHPAQYPDTGNGIYTIRVLEINKTPDGAPGSVQLHNASLKPGQEHLELRPGLYLTHINDIHLLNMSCDEVISTLQSVPRPTTLRFIDVEAGVVTPHELHDSLKIDKTPSILSPTAEKISVEAVPSPTNGRAPYKIILLGTTGVGKSSLLAVGVNGDNAYTERRATTLEAEFGSVEIPYPDLPSTILKARIWDTAGQERYRAITRSHYRRADGALLVYDVAEPESFQKLGEWLKALKDTAGDSLQSIMVLENKIDQLPINGPRPSKFVQEDVVSAWCKEHGLLFARTTAKKNSSAQAWHGQKVCDVIRTLMIHIHRGGGSTPIDREKIKLTQGPSVSIGNCGSCSKI